MPDIGNLYKKRKSLSSKKGDDDWDENIRSKAGRKLAMLACIQAIIFFLIIIDCLVVNIRDLAPFPTTVEEGQYLSYTILIGAIYPLVK